MALTGSGYSERPHAATGVILEDLCSTDTLLNAEVFTSPWINVEGFDSIIVAIATDQSGGYSIQFSPDGVNQDSTLSRTFVAGNVNAPHRFTITRKYARVVFTNNSGTDQTYFRLQTSVGSYHPLNTPADGTLSKDYDAIATRPTDYHYEVALGLREGVQTFNQWGHNDDIDTADSWATIWEAGENYVPLADGAEETLTIVSTSANDTASGGNPLVAGSTGAASVQITGIDANRKTVVETVALNGTTPVTSTNTFLGVNRMAALYSGSNRGNVGDIEATMTTDGRVMSHIPADKGSSQQCFFHVQYQASAIVDWFYFNVDRASGGGAPTIEPRFLVYSPTTNAYYNVFESIYDTATTQDLELKPTQPFVLSPGDVIMFQIRTNTNDTQVHARFSLIEVQQSGYDPSS